MSENYDPENERKSLQLEKIHKIRVVLEKAKESKKIEWEETEDEFVIKLPSWHREYSKHNPLKKSQAEKNIGLIEKRGGLNEIKEDEDTFSITTYDRVVHLPKWEEIPLPGFEGGKLDIDKMIKVFLENPSAGMEGKISETAEGLEGDKG